MSRPTRACVDVVVSTHNAAELVQSCLDHLVDESIAGRIVVDDASEDNTVEALAARPGVEVLGIETQRGLAHALNRGAERGCAPYLLFLNNDVLPAVGAIDCLVEALSACRRAASAAGRLVDHVTGQTQPSYQPRAFPGPAGVVARLVGLERVWPANPVTGQHVRDPLPQTARTLTFRQPAGACLLVRRSDHERIGGWDERYPLWYEDVDYSRRLLEFGPALYEPGAIFLHIGRASTAQWTKPQQHHRLYHGTLQYSATHFGRIGCSLVGATAAAVALPRIASYRHRDAAAADVYRGILQDGVALARGRYATARSNS